MKTVTFERSGGAGIGVVSADGASIVDLATAAPDLPSDLVSLIAANRLGDAARAAKAAPASAIRPLKGLALLPPIPRPGKIICLGLNYADHAAEGGHAKPEYPSFFMRGATSLVAHGRPIVRPKCSDKLDYEAELAVIIGRRARNVTRADALGHVAGYSCFNDATLRDYQRRTSQWTIGKNFDATGGFGPFFVSADEVPPGAVGLDIASRLNGQTMQGSNTRNMLTPVDEAIALLTECMTLEPGDVIAMGTPSGVGYARKPPVFMKPGDTIEIAIEKIGVLANMVVDQD